MDDEVSAAELIPVSSYLSSETPAPLNGLEREVTSGHFFNTYTRESEMENIHKIFTYIFRSFNNIIFEGEQQKQSSLAIREHSSVCVCVFVSMLSSYS